MLPGTAPSAPRHAEVTVTLPARTAYVTREAVAAVLAQHPSASLRAVRQALGGGSLRDVTEMVKAVRQRRVQPLRAALAADTDLGTAVVDVVDRLIGQIAQLQVTVEALATSACAPIAAPAPATAAALTAAATQAAAAVDVSVSKRLQHAIETLDARVAKQLEPLKKFAAAEAKPQEAVAHALRAVEARVEAVASAVDTHFRKRQVTVVPAPPVPPDPAGTVTAHTQSLQRLTNTVDAQFGLVKQVVQSLAQARPPGADAAPAPIDPALADTVRREAQRTQRLLRTQARAQVATQEALAARLAGIEAALTSPARRRPAAARKKAPASSTATRSARRTVTPSTTRSSAVATTRTPRPPKRRGTAVKRPSAVSARPSTPRKPAPDRRRNVPRATPARPAASTRHPPVKRPPASAAARKTTTTRRPASARPRKPSAHRPPHPAPRRRTTRSTP